MSKFRSIFLFFFLLSTFYFLLSTPIHAANFLLDKQSAIKSGSNQEAWLNEALGSNLVSGIIMLSGSLPESILNGQPPADGQITYEPGGAIGATTKLVASLYNPPASGIEYIAQIKDEFLGKPAYAQGVGFRSLQPILPIWRTFRNIVYIFSSILFILLGVLIIFRVKINPQTVVNIQNAIPQLIVTLVLVTFSYAIAGLLIDLSYFIQSIFIMVLFNASGTDIVSGNLVEPGVLTKVYDTLKNIFTGSNTFTVANNFEGVSNPGLYKFWGLMKYAVPTASLTALGAILGGVVGLILGRIGGAALGALVGGSLIFFIIQIIILIALIRFFFGLIKVYITIILKIILAPFEIGIGAFPNSKIGFTSWITDLIANILVFPASLVFILLVDVIVKMITNTDIWTPTLLGSVAGINLIPLVVGIGGILLLPKLPELIPQIIFQLKPSPFGTAIGQSFSQTTAPITALGWAGGQYLSDKQQGNFAAKQTAAQQPGGPQLSRWDRFVNVVGNAAGYASGGKVRRK